MDIMNYGVREWDKLLHFEKDLLTLWPSVKICLAAPAGEATGSLSRPQ